MCTKRLQRLPHAVRVCRIAVLFCCTHRFISQGRFNMLHAHQAIYILGWSVRSWMLFVVGGGCRPLVVGWSLPVVDRWLLSVAADLCIHVCVELQLQWCWLADAHMWRWICICVGGQLHRFGVAVALMWRCNGSELSLHLHRCDTSGCTGYCGEFMCMHVCEFAVVSMCNTLIDWFMHSCRSWPMYCCIYWLHVCMLCCNHAIADVCVCMRCEIHS